LLRALSAPVGGLSLHTNAISRQMLLDALQGHFAERLTEVVRCVCGGGGSLAPACGRWKSDTVRVADVLVRAAVRIFTTLTARPILACATENHSGDRHAARAATIAC